MGGLADVLGMTFGLERLLGLGLGFLNRLGRFLCDGVHLSFGTLAGRDTFGHGVDPFTAIDK